MPVIMSHRLEELAGVLAERLAAPQGSPLAADEVIVPSTAVRHWLSLFLADRAGICANVRFSYLAMWLWEQMARVLPVGKESPYAAPLLCWRIFGALGDEAFTKAYPRLAAWLEGRDAPGRYELACRLAALFEQYLTYRPDWLLRWFEGKSLDKKLFASGDTPLLAEDEAWQAALWRRIESETGSDGVHPARRFFEALEADGALAARLPSRVHVFCLPTMAPQYLEMLERLGEWVDVCLYVLNPCREFWLDVVPEKRAAVAERMGREMYFETGHPLLGAWGRSCQSQLALLMERGADDWNWVTEASPQPPSQPSLLAVVQASIRQMEALSLEGLAADDRSLEVHVCHSLMREVEVLHDQLLALFASDKALRPGEVVVVTPDIDRVAPLVDAIFGSGVQETRLPYRIMGRSGGRINPVARALVDVLALAMSRFTAADVYDLLLQPLVAARFGLEHDLEAVHGWMAEAGICWGLDGRQRLERNLPPDDSRSFHDGFYRLFLAYALPQGTFAPFGGRLPAGNPQGTEAVVLGALWHLLRQLGRLQEALTGKHHAAGWREVVLGALEDFVCTDDAEVEEALAVRQAIADVFGHMAAADEKLPVEAAVMRRALADALESASRGVRPSGAVTFAPMAGLRNLPCRFVYAIGMDDGVFPAQAKEAEFDLMAHAPRIGDLNRREDDRNVFLDLLLAAGERLTISYTGKSARDNTERPPSIVVSELLDVIVRALAKDRSKAALDDAQALVKKQLVLEHPLQAFSRRYFDTTAGDARMRSANADFCAAQAQRPPMAALLAAGVQATDARDHAEEEDGQASVFAARFFAQPLGELDAAWRDVSLVSLVRFFENPSRFLLENRLGLRLPSEEDELPADEPLVEDNLNRYKLATRLLPLLLAGESLEAVHAAARAGLEYPPGAMGNVLIGKMVEELAGFAGRFAQEMEAPLLPPVAERLAFELEGEHWSLFGALPDVRENGLVTYRFGHMGSGGNVRFRLQTWLRHLFLNAVAPQGASSRSVCYFSDQKITFAPCPPEEAKDMLASLLALYREGLAEPLRFFPESAAAYMEGDEKPESARIEAAAKKWQGNDWSEGNNPFHALTTRGMDDPLDAVFARHVQQVMAPMAAKMTQEAYDENA